MVTPIRKFISNGIVLLNKLHVTIGLVSYLAYGVYHPLLAQVCNESSGEFLINQTFGSAGTSSLGELTTYQYIPQACPSDGQYTVSETVDGTCFNSTWHNVTTDHTPGDVRGNVMIVNGTNAPGTFYQQSVSSLCGGTSYEISLWVMNLLRTGTCQNPLLPNLSISIETKTGLVIQTADIGLVLQTDSPTWRRYSTLFTASTTTDEVVIKLINYQGNYGCGNDIVIDDIQLKQCGECVTEQVYVPDVFTPNNDGKNDALEIFLNPAATFNLNVYNRWGSVIFTSTSRDSRWDGTYAGAPCLPGNYSWSLTYRFDQPSRKGREYVRTGQILLLR
ncbi:gliding motility-associated C-terminal domain-containing protein [Spirosoma soli]|uniref:Gliding motility-associated C-terminal domain-containing protein n=1 Tax=Spirosoma soli TaxID=1770529 RepID=A0ABW5M2Z5_9BACT